MTFLNSIIGFSSEHLIVPRRQVLLDHQRHLEDDGVVELPEVEARELLDLFQPVDQGVAVDEELAGGLGDVQIVFKEFIDGKQGLLVERVDGVLLEHFAQEDFAERGGKLIDQPADAEVFVGDDGLLGVEDLADLDGDLGLLVGVGQLAQMLRHAADADDRLDEELAAQRLLHASGQRQKLVLLHLAADALDHGHVGLVDRDHEVLLAVGEEVLQRVHDAHVHAAGLADQEHDVVLIRGKMQLLGADVVGRFFKLYLYTALAPVPLSTFAGEPTQSIGKSFLKSYAAVCLEGVIIVLSCIIFSLFASSPPVVDASAAAVTQVWTYIGELVFNMLVLVGTIKMSDRVVREMMGL